MSLYDVAAEAGVALNTARKAINDDPTVRPKLKERVLAAAEKLGYRPNVLARGLKRQSLNLVPISVIKLEEPYFGGLARYLSDELVEAGLEPLLCTDTERLLELNETLCTCGSIISYAVDAEQVSLLAKEHKVVTVNAPDYELKNAANIKIDFDTAYQAALTRVLENGRKRVAILSDLYCNIDPLARGMKFGSVESGLPSGGAKLVRNGRQQAAFADEEEICLYLKKHKNGIDAVFCENDLLAARLYGRLSSMGYRIPEDILLIGCDANLQLSGCWSLRIDTHEIARRAVALLLCLLSGKKVVTTDSYVPELIDTREGKI